MYTINYFTFIKQQNINLYFCDIICELYEFSLDEFGYKNEFYEPNVILLVYFSYNLEFVREAHRYGYCEIKYIFCELFVCFQTWGRTVQNGDNDF